MDQEDVPVDYEELLDLADVEVKGSLDDRPQADGPLQLLSLQPELLACLASQLARHHLPAFRQTCRALSDAADAAMTLLTLQLALLPNTSAGYTRVSPTWLKHVTQLRMVDDEDAQALDRLHPHPFMPGGCRGTSPLALLLMLYGPGMRCG